MNKEIIDNIFNETNEKYLDYLNSEEFEKNLGDIKDQGLEQIIGGFSAAARDDAVVFVRTVLIKLFNSDDFKRELFNDMMEQAKEEAKRTQRNPFEV